MTTANKSYTLALKSLIFLCVMLATNVVFGQIRSDLSTLLDDLDYHGYLKKYKKYKNPTFEETIEAAKVAYRVSDFELSDSLIRFCDEHGVFDQDLKIIQYDLLENRSRDINETNIWQIQSFDESLNSSHFVSLVEDSLILYSQAPRDPGFFSNEDLRTGKSYLELKSKFVGKKNPTVLFNEYGVNYGPICRIDEGYMLTTNYLNFLGQRKLRLVILNNEFEVVREFPFNDPTHSVGHAFFDENRQRLIYVSDSKSGTGGTDLWASDRKNGVWTTPYELKQYNTEGNEMFPTISGDSLYFSSNGRNGFGELDIYCTDLGMSEGEIVHLPGPINTRSDDFLLLPQSSEELILSSNRGSKRTDQTFRLRREDGTFSCDVECENTSCKQFSVTGFEDLFANEFEFRWDFGDGETGVGFEVSHCYEKLGSFVVKLDIFDRNNETTYQAVMRDTVNVAALSTNFPEFTVSDTSVLGETIQFVSNGKQNFGQIANTLWTTSEGYEFIGESPDIQPKKTGYMWIQRSIRYDENDSCCYRKFKRWVFVLDSNDVKNGDDNGDQIDYGPTDYWCTIHFDNQKIDTRVHLEIWDNQDQKIVDTIVTSKTVEILLSHKKNYRLLAKSGEDGATQTLSSNGKTELEFEK